MTIDKTLYELPRAKKNKNNKFKKAFKRNIIDIYKKYFDKFNYNVFKKLFYKK